MTHQHNSTIPNSFPTPNFFVDELMHLLTDREWRVLCYMTRHIFGWQDKINTRMRRLSLSMFVSGFGKFHGCGLSRPAVSAALESLQSFGIIEKVGQATNDGQMWTIPPSDANVKYDALKERHERTHQKHQKQTANAIKTSAQKRRNLPSGGTLDVLPGGTLDIPPAGTLDVPLPTLAGGTLDVPNQSQVKSQVKSQENSLPCTADTSTPDIPYHMRNGLGIVPKSEQPHATKRDVLMEHPLVQAYLSGHEKEGAARPSLYYKTDTLAAMIAAWGELHITPDEMTGLVRHKIKNEHKSPYPLGFVKTDIIAYRNLPKPKPVIYHVAQPEVLPEITPEQEEAYHVSANALHMKLYGTPSKGYLLWQARQAKKAS